MPFAFGLSNLWMAPLAERSSEASSFTAAPRRSSPVTSSHHIEPAARPLLRPPLSIAPKSAHASLREETHPCSDGKHTWHRPKPTDSAQKLYGAVNSPHPSHRTPIPSALPGFRIANRSRAQPE